MERDDFWGLIQTLGPRARDADFVRLTDALASRDADDILGFEDLLTELLHALDTPAHAAAARARNDWFLYVRCAVVAAGRRAYEEVVAEPARLKRFARREAQLLLTVASQAYERSTGMLWEHETRFSYESGSNADAWGDTEPTPEPPKAQEPMPWLRLHATVALSHGWPAAYVPLVQHVGAAIVADPAWEAWWSAAGVPECRLFLLLSDERFGAAGTIVKVGRARVEAHAVLWPEPFASTEPQRLLPRVVDDVNGLVESLRTHLDLAQPPPLRLPELPADLPTGTTRIETLTSILGGHLLRGPLARLRGTRAPNVNAATAAFGAVVLVGAVGAGLGADGVRYGAAATALLALGVCTALAGRSAPPPLRRALVGFCLLLAASAVVHLAAHWIPVPDPAPMGRNGCPIETEATTAYWRSQLRHGQVAEIMHYLALACTLRAVRMLPPVRRSRPWRRPLVAVLLQAPLVAVGVLPIFSASDVPAVFAATAPGVLTLVTAVILFVLTVTRIGGYREAERPLLVGVLLMMISSRSAVETLADIHSQLPDPAPGFILMGGCFYGVAATSISLSAILGAATYLIAPALFVRSALRIGQFRRSSTTDGPTR